VLVVQRLAACIVVCNVWGPGHVVHQQGVAAAGGRWSAGWACFFYMLHCEACVVEIFRALVPCGLACPHVVLEQSVAAAGGQSWVSECCCG
jgi:hypothetical protein